MIRNVLAVGIVLLFVGTCIIPAIAHDTEKPSQSTSRGNWLYVGGSGPGNYSVIQDAVDNASDGDTIYVYAGIYSNITIYKSLQLKGENKYTTIIIGSGKHNTINVEANQVTISGFTIQNRDFRGSGDGIGIEGRTNITISDMILTQNHLGIEHFSNINILLDNITFSANAIGISFFHGKNCIITHCIFTNNGIGISHYGFSYGASSGESLYIKSNLFLNNSAFFNNSAAISLSDCIDAYGDTIIEGNSFQYNYCGITTDTCKGVNILKNNFINNTHHVLLSRINFIREALSHINYKQHWMNNYWDDYNQNHRYFIHGLWTLCIGNKINYLPILRIPYKEFDSNPAQEPYDISG